MMPLNSRSGRDVVAQDYINKLNRVRVDLKHHGIIPDVAQWGAVAERVFGHISAWCQEYLQIDYAQLDAAELIRSTTVLDTIRAARKHLQEGNFRECLEALAQAIFESGLQLFPMGLHVPVGVANAETALELSAYGIDPGRYLVLQRLLPGSQSIFFQFKPHWNDRRYGHKGNWTKEKAEFAHGETIDLLVRLQHADPYPTPYLYEDVFRDVLIVKTEAPKVRILKWDFDGWTVSHKEVKFAVGDRIECRAFGSILALSEINDPDKGFDFGPENAPRVVAKDIQNWAKLDMEGGAVTVLVFEQNDVEVTSEPWR